MNTFYIEFSIQYKTPTDLHKPSGLSKGLKSWPWATAVFGSLVQYFERSVYFSGHSFTSVSAFSCG